MLHVFGDYTLDTQRYELRRTGTRIKLRPKVFDLLAYLILHRNRVISRQELLDHLWPNQFVGEATLNSCIMEARQAVGDTGQTQRIIQTVHGRGYRFVAVADERVIEASDDQRQLPSAGPPPMFSSSHEPGASASDGLVPTRGLGAATAGERKQVTVLSCALANAGPLAAGQDPETVFHRMQELFAVAQRVLQHYQGTLSQRLGSGFLALFGAPLAQEDHARRAILVALELQETLRASRGGMSPPLWLCIGIHTGVMVVGQLGEQPPALSATVGEPIDLAVRLQQMAAPGHILMSAATYQFVQGEVRVEACEAINIEGRTPPLAVYQVHGLAPQPSGMAGRGGRPLSPFVGRGRELAMLQTLLAHAEAGHGQVIGVSGDPGLGKSRLLYEFRRSLRDRRVGYLEGHCVSYGSATPYLPVIDLVRQLCGITDVDLPEVRGGKLQRYFREIGMAADAGEPYVRQLLGGQDEGAPPVGLSPQMRKAQTFAILRQTILQSSQQQPLVIAVENTHWIDPTSEEYLASLVDNLAGAAILLLTTYRSGYQPPWLGKSYVTQLALPRLTSRDSLAVVQSVWPSAPHLNRLTSVIVAKAAGNPFFLEELARAALERGSRPPAMAVPETVQAVLAARIDRLLPAEKRLLQAASVIGQEVSLALLSTIAVLPEEVLQQSLRALQRSEFLYETRALPEPVYTFQHVLTQEVAYQSLLMSTRRQYHQRIARALEEQFPEVVESQPERVASHYAEADCQAQAVPYWQRAGRHALERSANREAIEHLTRGLDALKTLPDTPGRAQQELGFLTVLGLALVATQGQAHEDVGRTYVRALELCQQQGEASQRFQVLWGLLSFYVVRAELQAAWEVGERLLGLARDQHDPALLMVAHWALGQTLLFRGELVQAREHLEQAMTLYAPQQHHSVACSAGFPGDLGVFCLCFVAHTLWHLGYPDQAHTRISEALTMAQELAHPYSLALAHDYAAMLFQFRREGSMAQESADTAMALCTEQGFAYYLAWATILQGWALVVKGRGEEGLAQMHHGLTAIRDTGAALRYPYYLTLLAEAYGTVGQGEKALSMLAEALAEMHKTGERWSEAELYRLKGELFLQRSRVDAQQAEVCFQQALDIARHQQAKSLELRAAMSLARLWQCQGKRAEAYDLLAPIYGWFTEGFDTADLQEAQALLDELV
jgi:class 3 adenylate cyclase/predicted ATPase